MDTTNKKVVEVRRTIETVSLPGGKYQRTETTVTTADTLADLDRVAPVVRSPLDCATGPSLWDTIFGTRRG